MIIIEGPQIIDVLKDLVVVLVLVLERVQHLLHLSLVCRLVSCLLPKEVLCLMIELHLQFSLDRNDGVLLWDEEG